MRRDIALALSAFLVSGALAASGWQPKPPGQAKSVRLSQGSTTLFSLQNDAIQVSWRIRDKVLSVAKIEDRWNRSTLAGDAPLAVLTLRNGKVLSTEAMRVVSAPVLLRLAPVPKASRASERLAGSAISATLVDPDTGLRADWQADLRDGSHYVRQSLTLRAQGKPVDVKRVSFVNLKAPQAAQVGTTSGSPVMAGDWFFGFEHPVSSNDLKDGTVRCQIERALPLSPGQKTTYSWVVGVSPKTQLRRSFLAYVERERAHPYRPFLHYNSWYDLGYFTKFDARQCVERIEQWADALTRKRGVQMASFLFDDGWDDTSTVWEFHSGFPQGFRPLMEAAQKAGAAPGIWLSPWGGYGGPRNQRLATGGRLGYEIDSQGYALSGPKYYKRFREVCLDLVQRHGINHFKFDGTGSPDKQYPGSAFASDFEAAIQLISDLRSARPDLFVNLTTGTWPSPFWLHFADSIWRGGSDHGFSGVGTDRQRWITYRDGDTYRGVVRKGPLFPINSLMLHGLIYAQHAHQLNADPGDDFRDEIRSYFGSGTQLQEMYVTPTLLSEKNLDDLAESAKWSAANASILADVHWVGGDPGRLEVYGWAAWTPKKAILTLRNPSDRPQAFSIDPVLVFELPPGHRPNYRCTSPYSSDRGDLPLDLPPGASKVVDLKPFEVLTLECVPTGGLR